MRSIFVALAAFVALGTVAIFTATGCGGGGSTSGSGGTTGSVVLYPSTATLGPNGRMQLLAQSSNLAVDVTWSSTAGVVTPTGIGTAIFDGPASGSATITATKVGGTSSDSTDVVISAGMATVSGRIIDSQAFLGIQNAIVDFRNGSTVLASVSTMPNGYFSVAVPLTATRFHIRPTSISNGFYKQYTYNSFRYTMLDSNCTAPLPALSAGANVSLLTNITISPASGPPPPPPNGCP